MRENSIKSDGANIDILEMPADIDWIWILMKLTPERQYPDAMGIEVKSGPICRNDMSRKRLTKIYIRQKS
jgi:hypothetical protein